LKTQNDFKNTCLSIASKGNAVPLFIHIVSMLSYGKW